MAKDMDMESKNSSMALSTQETTPRESSGAMGGSSFKTALFTKAIGVMDK